MNIQSWMIKSWATLEWYLSPESGQLPAFHHVGTQLRDDGSDSGLRAGDAVWVAQHEQWYAGLAWEWAEVKPGIVMLTDPNSIITNLQFVDEDRQPVPSLLGAVAVNRLVHALPWQRAVCAALQLHQPQQGLAAPLATAAHSAPRHPASRPMTAGDFQLLGYVSEPSMPAAAPFSHSISAPGWQAPAEPVRRNRTRATDREAGIETLPPLQNLRRAA